MTNRPCPSPAPVLAGLKDFQRRTVDYVFKRLYLDADSTHRFLVADEVGLGKTMIARGVIARTVERLWDTVKRIDIVYVCSNADIARQNIDNLRISPGDDFVRATRATLLPIQLRELDKHRVNFISMTPGTSLEPRGGTGIAEERALLYVMLRKRWDFHRGRGLSVLRCNVGYDRFESWVRWMEDQPIDKGLWAAFLRGVEAAGNKRAPGVPSLKHRFEQLCEKLPRRDSRLDDSDWEARRQLIAELRAILGRTCISALQPDLVVLDEFQRFKHLLDPTSEEAELARTLFAYADDREGQGEAVRVLLLSATPYKMYTLQHEHDRGETDHYQDFVATYDFLTRHDAAAVAHVRGLLREYRTAMFRLADGGLERLRAIKADLEESLRRVMARTERLAATADRSGMLRECPISLRLEDADLDQYLGAIDVAKALDHGEVVEYWKSAPYLLNFMDNYQIKHDLKAAAARQDQMLVAALGNGATGLLSWKDVLRYRRIDPANARLRALLASTVDEQLWQWLWLPPGMPYYRLGGPFADASPTLVTKRLVFSSWKVVPKVIAAVLSHEAERRMIGLSHTEAGEVEIENSDKGRKRIAARLRFTRAEGRMTGMPVLGLVYPSTALAHAIDPAHGFSAEQSVTEVTQMAADRLRAPVEQSVARWGGTGEVDEQWYWAAPLLLDLVEDPLANSAFWSASKLAQQWSATERGSGDDEDPEDSGTAWSAHVEEARRLVQAAASGERPLGAPPADLLDVLATSAIGSPAVLALRAFARVTVSAAVGDPAARLAAGRVAHRLRNLFNLPEVISLVSGLAEQPSTPYWRQVLAYCIDGCLPSVLDEYAHVIRSGLGQHMPDEAIEAISERMCRAIGLRAAQVGLDDIKVDRAGTRVDLNQQRMRARFAARFGQEKSDDRDEVTRADQVRAAFNSPFWPFVLASTSVGQEGLDFHHYCHAVVHWNLPSNPVDLEQREGRIHRYKGHAVRKNVALDFAGTIDSPLTDRWEAAFRTAQQACCGNGAGDLVPFWVYTHEQGAAIERHVPTLPLSRDAERHRLLRGALAIYRMVFGQPRQEELVSYLLTHFPREQVDAATRELRIDLEPREVAASPQTPAQMAAAST